MSMSVKKRLGLARAALVCLTGLLAPMQFAQADDAGPDRLTARKVDAAKMDTLRGGMAFSNLGVDINLRRSVYINGVLQAENQFQWNSNDGLATSQAPFPTALVIQNVVNDQIIRTITTIDAQVANLSIFRQMINNYSVNQSLVHGIIR
ncbi:hypothetical protein [Crenobacter cavernae]|uniref:Uncharacterized protein n=1 Tax=Crenobacter cavernae TaxID=2290923 RepID=A0A345Y9I6_9NEIS|nr:hypothetical protein [Crenobacter cavernae]AXK40588.1 hypothetical protein DWG20_14775 [Crenobacter cavernae]